MAKTPTVDEAVERARRAQDERIEVVRVLAAARQALVDERTAAAERLAAVERDNAEKVGEAERKDVRTYQAAIKAGWTREQLRKIGFDEPAKVRRARRKRTGMTASPAASDGKPDAADDDAGRPSPE